MKLRRFLQPVVYLWLGIAITGLTLIGPSFAQTLGARDATHASKFHSAAERIVVPLDRAWQLKYGEETHQATVDTNWENFLGVEFDGRATYSNDLQQALQLLEKQAGTHSIATGRTLLEIDGAATAAIVRVDGQEVANHLGGWTPFRIDITQHVRAQLLGAPSDQGSPRSVSALEIDLDERVGHNSQGFLPIVVPHFGGIWKGVRIVHTRGPVYLDDMTIYVAGHAGEKALSMEALIRGAEGASHNGYEVGIRELSDSTTPITWVQPSSPQDVSPPASTGTDKLIGKATSKLLPVEIRVWSPDSPNLYDVEILLRDRESGEVIDRVVQPASIRHFSTRGRKQLINDRPVNIRGVLNWGYAPPRLCPAIDEEAMREEIAFAKSRGFNLMKFCLWIPPRRYLELADEMGMLTWIEYPTWHPDFSEGKYEELRQEFEEFFVYDRNTASAILRSLTCETGHSASVDVIRGLYDLGHDLVPGAIIEDDSSWIGWHRVHDFYDDHPYGNNDTWLETLARLDDHIREREPMPLVLGEAIAADTWESPVGASTPLQKAHASLSSASQDDYWNEVAASHQLESKTSVRKDSYDVGFEMRKYQMEAFRWRLPDAGYVVSVLRDFPKASMGLIDRRGHAKWPTEDYDWHGPVQLVLNQGETQRSFAAGRTTEFELGIAAEASIAGPFDVRIDVQFANQQSRASVLERQFHPPASQQHSVPFTVDLPAVSKPTSFQVTAVLRSENEILSKNRWKLWAIPTAVQFPESLKNNLFISDDIALQSILDAGFSVEHLAGDVREIGSWSSDEIQSRQPVLVVRRFSPKLLDWVAQGARCLMLPDGAPGSLVTKSHWFLRGGPIMADHTFLQTELREMIVDLQTFDLSGPVLHEFPLLDQGTPVVSLWDNHDLDHYRTHGLLWESKVGAGHWIVSVFNHDAQAGAAGPYLLRELVRRLSQNPDTTQLTPAVLQRLRKEINQRQISLAGNDWFFRRATAAETSAIFDDLDWIQEDVQSEEGWEAISITSHWDGQGHGDLDGWGLYRTEIVVPERWQGEDLYITFTGVDDYFDVIVAGNVIGSGGDIEQRETAFELRKSFPIPKQLIRDQKISLAVRVFDWQGAGGIFRPVYLSTEPVQAGPAWVVPQ